MYKRQIIDYSVYDAIKAGFNKIVFIIKRENYELFPDILMHLLYYIQAPSIIINKINNTSTIAALDPPQGEPQLLIIHCLLYTSRCV